MIDAFKFSHYEDDYDDNKIIYIPKYNLYAYYESNKFVVYKLEKEFNQQDYYNVENIMIPELFAKNIIQIYDMDNEIKIISKNNRTFTPWFIVIPCMSYYRFYY